ncbi:MAG: tRNA uridine-5-carboxymethylaminomethyl(34) synthesis enzyme MnmG [Planctomycetes bacterium]|jgi:tRNA uridine 5-carboxymethylaminomethyl modification enzyme|nr:tRNA uridine-5-carboxymethylaminomethyl(34) synthesis enzyme MnmG [Planctomycetota bacterium]MBT4559699.1 tRNA uridine-5-carboxymethylaminomethyl(34) synthesis enzyme MnmG [Planctomycetota bacterium]MBT7319483.1 tRNA uridine-5-carboxymethylaminomethyl(34) synthesis enzyme MnmG [Planctomycetota bacterium]
MNHPDYAVVVIGGGHAGVEAAAAAARAGACVALITQEPDALGRMSCNPAIGGIGKGQLAREVDALGGLMGLAADAAGIQFRLLNTSKGRAVQSPRAQCDRDRYEQAVCRLIAQQDGLDVIQGEAVSLVLEPLLFEGDSGASSSKPQVTGVRLADGRAFRASEVILTTGTFLDGVLHTGPEQVLGGRMGEKPAAQLGEDLRKLGLPLGRLKTGTPPRIAIESVDFSQMEEQHGDESPVAFSFLTPSLPQRQISCWLTRTNPHTHQVVRDHLHLAPMYAGRIEGKGPRYCPSLEDKVVRFSDRDGHTIFLEPEGFDSDLLYANGISTSLPVEAQEQFVQTCVGLENARLVQPGYAVEYTFVAPRALHRSLAVRDVGGLWLAGQICGTSGYEEAAAQGLLAGLNAARRVAGLAAWVPARHEAYLGVLVDDLVVSDPSEPYRMFTSRAEHRLLLRHDNADLRLTPHAIRLGLCCEKRRAVFKARCDRLEMARAEMTQREAMGEPRKQGRKVTLLDLLRRPGASFQQVFASDPSTADWGLLESDQVTLEADVLYEGYARRQQAWVDRGAEREAMQLPLDFDFAAVSGLRNEAVLTLTESRPETLGAAGRLAGVTPADLALLEIALAR